MPSHYGAHYGRQKDYHAKWYQSSQLRCNHSLVCEHDRHHLHHEVHHGYGYETESDEFAAMISYFESKAHVTDPDGTAAFLVLDNLKNKKGMSFITLNGSFLDFYNRVPNKKEFFESIDDNEVKRGFIENVKDSVDKWLDVVVSLYPSYMNAFMAKTISDGSKKRLYKVLSDSVLSCRENPDFFIYLTNTFGPKDSVFLRKSDFHHMDTSSAQSKCQLYALIQRVTTHYSDDFLRNDFLYDSISHINSLIQATLTIPVYYRSLAKANIKCIIIS